jgi:hypothetical protein
MSPQIRGSFFVNEVWNALNNDFRLSKSAKIVSKSAKSEVGAKKNCLLRILLLSLHKVNC